MSDARSVAITGASRGRGPASAKELHRRGVHVVGAMRSPDAAPERICEATGAVSGDPRLTAVRLDRTDRESVKEAGAAIQQVVGASDAVVHHAGVSALGFEETPLNVRAQVLATNLFSPVALTNALLPAMRAAGCGRIVGVSSQGEIWGMPSAAYSAVKSADDRWEEALAGEALAKSLDKDSAPLVRRGEGIDAKTIMVGDRVLPVRGRYQMVCLAMGQPRQGSTRNPLQSR